MWDLGHAVTAGRRMTIATGAKTMIAPETLYCGPRATVIAEVGGMAHIYPGVYLMQPDGPAEYDAEGADTIEELRDLVAEYLALFPTARVVWF